MSKITVDEDAKVREERSKLKDDLEKISLPNKEISDKLLRELLLEYFDVEWLIQVMFARKENLDPIAYNHALGRKGVIEKILKDLEYEDILSRIKFPEMDRIYSKAGPNPYVDHGFKGFLQRIKLLLKL